MFRSFEGKPVSMTSTSRVTGTIRIYDPAMCCSTGVCGPGVDTALLRLARDVRWLEAQGITVERFNLSQQPGAFVEHPRVAGLLQAFGEQALPVTLVNDTILVYGRYPSREEVTNALLGSAQEPTTSQEASSQCCEPGSGCCE